VSKRAVKVKESKADALLREEAERRLEYEARLMAALAFASEQRWSLYVRDRLFVVDADPDADEEEYSLSYSWSPDSGRRLRDLELAVEQETARQTEATRKMALRESALAKMTDEEAVAMGFDISRRRGEKT
jgi:hypothetical protein